MGAPQTHSQQSRIEEPLIPRSTFARLAAIAQAKSNPSVFWKAAFQEIATASGALYARFALSAGVTVLEDYAHQGPTNPDFWKPTVNKLIDEAIGEDRDTVRAFKARRNDRLIAMLVVPLRDTHDHCVGAIALVIEVPDATFVRYRLSELRAAATYIAFLAATLGRTADKSVTQTSAMNGSTLERLASTSTLHELAFAITNNLSNKLGCEQVAVGLMRRNRVRVLAISGFDNVSHRNPGVRVIAAAMEEAGDAQTTIIHQETDQWDADAELPEYRLHRQWFAAACGAAVASIPFIENDRCIAVLSLRAMPGSAWDRDTLAKVEEQVAPFAAGLGLVDRASRSMASHAASSLRATATALCAPRSWSRKILMLVILAAALWIALGSATYRVTTPCSIRPAVAQRLYAPFAGIIETVHVKVGDSVQAGQTLFSMNTDPLLDELRYLEAQTKIARITMNAALMAKDATAAELERTRISLFEAKAAILNGQIERSHMTAPYDGIVTVGDPNTIQGQMLALGDPVIEIIPQSQWIVELEVPEDSIIAMNAGLTGSLSLNARADASQRFMINRVLPQARDVGRSSIFTAEGTIEQGADWLRSGMEGTARIEIGKRPVWWIVSHRIVRAMQRNFWI